MSAPPTVTTRQPADRAGRRRFCGSTPDRSTYVCTSPVGRWTWVETQPTVVRWSQRAVFGHRAAATTTTPRDVCGFRDYRLAGPPANPLVGDLWWSPITGMGASGYDDATRYRGADPAGQYINLARWRALPGGI